MIKYLDRIKASDNDAVVSKVYEDGKVEVVYKNGQVVYEDAHLVDGKWEFVHKGAGAGYAKGKDRLRDAVAKLNMSAELRHRLGE